MIELFGENKPLPVTKMPFPNGLSYQFIVTGNNIWKQENRKKYLKQVKKVNSSRIQVVFPYQSHYVKKHISSVIQNSSQDSKILTLS